jgi:hypothetical protein
VKLKGWGQIMSPNPKKDRTRLKQALLSVL